jgi:hypothetical protein
MANGLDGSKTPAFEFRGGSKWSTHMDLENMA